MEEGARYFSLLDWRNAALHFCAAITLKPDRPAAYMSLGAVLDDSGKTVGAVKYYRKAMKRSIRGGLGLVGKGHGTGIHHAV